MGRANGSPAAVAMNNITIASAFCRLCMIIYKFLGSETVKRIPDRYFLYQPVDHKAEVIGHRINNSGMGFIPHAEILRSYRYA